MAGGDHGRGRGLAEVELIGARGHQIGRDLRLHEAREVPNLAGASRGPQVAGESAVDEPKRRPKLVLVRVMAAGHGNGS